MLTQISVLYLSMLISASCTSIIICGLVIIYHIWFRRNGGQKHSSGSSILAVTQEQDNWLTELIDRDLGSVLHTDCIQHMEEDKESEIEHNYSYRCYSNGFPTLFSFILTMGYFVYGSYLMSYRQIEFTQVANKSDTTRSLFEDSLCFVKYSTSFAFHIASISSCGVACIRCFSDKRYLGLLYFLQACIAIIASIMITLFSLLFHDQSDVAKIHLLLSSSYVVLFVAPMFRTYEYWTTAKSVKKFQIILPADISHLQRLKKSLLVSTIIEYICYLPNCILILLLHSFVDQSNAEMNLKRCLVIYPECSLQDDPVVGNTSAVLRNVIAVIAILGGICSGSQLVINLQQYFIPDPLVVSRNRRFRDSHECYLESFRTN